MTLLSNLFSFCCSSLFNTCRGKRIKPLEKSHFLHGHRVNFTLSPRTSRNIHKWGVPKPTVACDVLNSTLLSFYSILLFHAVNALFRDFIHYPFVFHPTHLHRRHWIAPGAGTGCFWPSPVSSHQNIRFN